MPYDRNGWLASPDLKTRDLVINGEPIQGGVLDHPDAFTVLQYVAQELNERVERIYMIGWHPADDWGAYYRANVNNPDSLSRHAFGLAFDYNATRHPNGTPASASFTSKQILEIRAIVEECGGAVQWGGDFNSTSDPMHFQIDATKSVVAAAARHIRDIKKDWFTMATEAQLREIVQAETPTASAVAKAVLAETIQVKRVDKEGNVRKVDITVEQALKEMFNNVTSG